MPAGALQECYCVQLEPPRNPEARSELIGRLAGALRLSAARVESLLNADTLVLDEHEAGIFSSVCRELRIPIEIARQGGYRFPLDGRSQGQRGQGLMLALATGALIFAIVVFTVFDSEDLSFTVKNRLQAQLPLVEVTADPAPVEDTPGQGATLSERAGEAPPAKVSIFTAAWEQDTEGLRAALESGANVNGRDSYGQTPLMYAAGHNSPEVVAALLEAGAQLNAQSDSGRSALMYAVRDNPNPEVAAVLLEAGADLGLETDEGVTAVEIARQEGGASAELFEGLFFRAAREAGADELGTLLAAGFGVNMRDAYGQTPLMYAVQNSAGVVRTLLAAGADVNAGSHAGWTALMYAARENPDPAVAQLLIDAGADIGMRNGIDQTARDIARASGNDAVLRIIEQALAPVAGSPAGPVQSATAQAQQRTARTSRARAADLEDPRRVILDCIQNWESCGNAAGD